MTKKSGLKSTTEKKVYSIMTVLVVAVIWIIHQMIVSRKQNQKTTRYNIQKDTGNLKTFCVISPYLLQDLIDEQTVCRHCAKKVVLVENISLSQSLGRAWALHCTNKQCPSQKSSDHFTTTKRSQYFEINHAAVLGFCTIRKGRNGAKKLFSLLNLPPPVSKKSWHGHTTAISERTNSLLTKNFKEESLAAKQYMQNTGMLNADVDLVEEIVEIAISVDGSWGKRGWSSRNGITDICFEETGKVLGVIHKTSYCKECSTMDEKKKSGAIDLFNYMEWYVKHETSCLKNHEGSAQVNDSWNTPHHTPR